MGWVVSYLALRRVLTYVVMTMLISLSLDQPDLLPCNGRLAGW